jgi:hypothetical protein
MAKKPVKTAAVKKSPAKKAPANENILKKLQELNIEQALQADIEWCIGSYRSDNNPSGLYVMADRALQVLAFELTKDPKSVPAKLIKDIEKALLNCPR